METHRITLLGKELEVLRPCFGFSQSWDRGEKEMRVWGNFNYAISSSDHYFYAMREGFRYFSLAEFAALVKLGFADWKNRTEEEQQATQVLGELLTVYVLKRGIGPKNRYRGDSIPTNHGVRLEGQELFVYDAINSQVEHHHVTGTEGGYCISDEVTSRIFSLERLFRRYDPRNVTLKQLDKSNPDLVEHLFGVEFEDLAPPFQEALVALPPDTQHDVGKVRQQWGNANIWPLALCLCFDQPKADDKYRQVEVELDSWVWSETTITPYYPLSGGVRMLIRDAQERGKA